MTRTIELGILDLEEDPEYAIEIAPVVDALGYSRYWLAEHHLWKGRCASPDILTALVAGLTERIRVGPGGVILNFRSPLKVAEDFRLLSTVFPDRIDLGLARGVADPASVTALLDGRPGIPSSEEHGRRVAEVSGLLRGDLADDHPLKPVFGPPPPQAAPPQIWVLGASRDSAAVAARLGAALGLAEHIATGRPNTEGPEAARYYREHFVPNKSLSAPVWSVCVGGSCAETEAEAQRAVHGLPAFFRTTWVGAPRQCQEQILEVADRYGANEVIVCDLGRGADNLEAKRRSYELLAAALLPDPA
jgi:luciferase family oxidoreductase group 1